MPSKTNTPEEFCFPCKYHVQSMIHSGQHPLYRMYCEHPTQIGRFDDRPRNHGRLIGDNEEHRPEWCPIRGDAKAEKEAERD